MGFCYPGKGKGGDLPPRMACAALWRHICCHFSRVTLTLVIGQYAHGYHFPGDKRSLTARVQAWQDEDVIPLPHPSPRNGVWLKANPWFEVDVVPRLRQKLRKSLNVAQAQKVD